MTNIVKKGAGRAAHAERTNRHAQRTPLPPKQRVADPAKTTAAIIKDEVQKAVKKSTRKATATTASEPKRTAKADSKKRTSPVAATAQKSGVGKVRPKKAAAHTPTAKTAVPKVRALLEHATSQGWTTEVALEPPYVIVTATRGDETLVTRFIDNKMDDTQMPYFVRADGSKVLMRNVSAVKKQMMADPALRPVRSERPVRTRYAGSVDHEEPQRRVPFNIDEATDADVAKALRGATITWRNGGTEPETAAVSGKRAPQVRQHPKFVGVGSRRVVSFFSVVPNDKGALVTGPERHVSLDRLLTVSR